MERTCAISQPTFLPWTGWFDLVDQADIMIILDDVQFSKQSWQQRNRLRTRSGLEYVSVPVKTAGRLGQRIIDCRLADERFVHKTIGTLQANYSKAPFFPAAADDFARALKFAASTNSLLELNCELIAWMAEKLAVATPMVRASALGAAGRRGEHVAELCEYVEADHYLSPAGAEAYLNEDRSAFDRRGITISIQVYEHPEYPQCFTPFMPYASALDLIFNAGPEAGAIMRAGRRPIRPIAADGAATRSACQPEDR
jgi:WbqC-like protein family